MKKAMAGVVAGLVVLLGGCVTPPQKPVQMSQQVFDAKAGKIGVAMSALPKVDTQFPGAGCLLCLATASAANSALTTHAQTLPYEDLPKLKNLLADSMRKKGMTVSVIEESINLDSLDSAKNPGENIARKDFSPLRAKYSVDKLLVVDINALGFTRPYSAYFPTGDPKAFLRGAGYIVNLSTNAYEWYMPVEVIRGADKAWDEPPNFPGLTNAYFQVLEVGKDTFVSPFNR